MSASIARGAFGFDGRAGVDELMAQGHEVTVLDNLSEGSLDNLKINLKENGFDLAVIPYALQFNKRDLPSAVAYDIMYRTLNIKGEGTFEAVAPKGIGVFETLKAVAKQVLLELSRK